MKNKLSFLLPIIIVTSFGIIAGFSLLHKGLPPTHDGEYHVVRFYLFDEAIRDGNLYPRWATHLNNNFGVPLFNFVYPLPNYIAVIFHIFGISFIDSFKLSMFLATIIGGIFFYLWSKEFWGRLGGIVASIFYTFSPYHFVEVYIRGTVGEVWALAFFPGFLWAFTKFVKSKRKIFFALSSLFLSLIIFSHNILALMFFFFALSYIVFMIAQERDKKFLILNALYALLFGLGLSSIFWLPALYETKFVRGLEIFDVTSHFPEFYQLLIPTWGSGFSGAGLRNELSFQIGIANLFGVLLSLTVMIMHIKERGKIFFYTTFFTLWFILIMFLMMEISTPVWKMIPLMNYFQFPWRLLSIEILFASFLAGSIFALKLNQLRIPLFLFLIFLAFILGIGYTKPAYYHYRDDNYYLTRSNFMEGTNSPGNVFNTIWFNQALKKQSEKIKIDKGKLESSDIKPTRHTYVISTFSESNVTVNIAYFPNWTLFIDGKKITTKQDANGLISFVTPKGSHLVEVKFLGTPVRVVANFVFLLSFFSILFYKMKWYNIARLLKKRG